MAKMEIELTDEQLEKVEILKENDIDVGQAIDMLFEAKEKLLSDNVDVEDDNNGIVDKIKDNALDVESKAENLDENFGEGQLSPDMQVMEYKHKIKWAREFFKF